MARRARQNEMSGIFDFLRGKKKSEQKSLFDVFEKPASQLPALPPQAGEMVPAPSPQRSVIDIFRPKPHLPAKAEPGKKEISLPDVFAPKLPARAEALPPEKAVEWGTLIPSTPPQPLTPVSEVVREVFRPPAPASAKYVFMRPSEPPQVEAKRSYEMIAVPQKRLEWQLPTVEQLAEHFRRTNNLEAMWDFIRTTRSSLEFKKDQLIASWRGDPMIVPLDPVVYKEKFTDFANFYGIPWAVMETYLNVAPEHEKTAEDALFADVISPLNVMVPEAFEMLKPQDIPGFFNVSFMDPTGQYYLFYVEPLMGIGGQGAA
jgi:hypothetical protein